MTPEAEAKPRGYIARAARGDWRTPLEVLDVVHAMWGRIDLDPCCAPDPAHTFAKGNLAGPTGTPGDGLAASWRGRVFVNPPFGDLADWAAKCEAEAKRGAEIVLLLPARTDTRYWHGPITSAQAICLWRGRITFVGAPAPCPFPVAFVYWGPRPWAFHAAFSPRGMVVVPSRSTP